jgi:alkylhydroperoxidase family enzyme
MSRHLQPLEAPFPPDIANILSRYPQQGGYLLTLFRTFANSKRFLERGVANLLDKESPLLLRQREIIILRVTANLDCEYEWGVHVAAFSRAAGLNDAQVTATRLAGADAECWTVEERLLLTAVDELCAKGRVSEATSKVFEATWTLEQQLEILALCGNYHTVAFVANTARLPPEAFAARFPAQT